MDDGSVPTGSAIKDDSAPVSTDDPQPRRDWDFTSVIDPLAGVLALMLPGLGHWVRGERRRGRLICAGVLGLFATGLLVGGIEVVDRRESRIWFMGQAGVGPLALGVDWVHQNVFKGVDRESGVRRSAMPGETIGPGGWIEDAEPGQRPPKIRSVAKVNELGTLFCAVAGMLNLIVILDATFPRRGGRTAAASGARKPESAGGAA